jgi:hypothetical protein
LAPNKFFMPKSISGPLLYPSTLYFSKNIFGYMGQNIHLVLIIHKFPSEVNRPFVMNSEKSLNGKFLVDIGREYPLPV